MLRSRRDRNCVSRSNGLPFIFNRHVACALENEIDLLRLGVIVPCGRPAWRQSGVGEALISNRGIPMGEEFTDLGPIGGDEGFTVVDIDDFQVWTSVMN